MKCAKELILVEAKSPFSVFSAICMNFNLFWSNIQLTPENVRKPKIF